MDDSTAQPNAEDGSQTRPALKQILYIEDSKTSQWVLDQKLAKIAGVTIAETLAESRQVIQTRRFDLIIVDWYLPDGKGTDLLPTIRARYSRQQLPVILVSASLDQTMMMQALQAGANDCHPKPICWADFTKAVERMVAAPYVNPLVKDCALVTWVEGHINDHFWLYCPEADLFLKGGDADAVRQDAARHLRILFARNSKNVPACQVNVSLHLVSFTPPPDPPPPTGP